MHAIPRDPADAASRAWASVVGSLEHASGIEAARARREPGADSLHVLDHFVELRSCDGDCGDSSQFFSHCDHAQGATRLAPEMSSRIRYKGVALLAPAVRIARAHAAAVRRRALPTRRAVSGRGGVALDRDDRAVGLSTASNESSAQRIGAPPVGGVTMSRARPMSRMFPARPCGHEVSMLEVRRAEPGLRDGAAPAEARGAGGTAMVQPTTSFPDRGNARTASMTSSAECAACAGWSAALVRRSSLARDAAPLRWMSGTSANGMGRVGNQPGPLDGVGAQGDLP